MIGETENLPAASRGARFGALILVVFIVAGAWFAMIGVRERGLTRAVRALPPEVQAATFRRAYEEVAFVCSDQPALADHCAEEARFLRRFPQCDAACQRLARRYFPVVRR